MWKHMYEEGWLLQYRMVL